MLLIIKNSLLRYSGTQEVDVEQIPQDQWQKKGGVPKADYQECLRLSRSLVEPSVHKPIELNDREVLTISYFYDRATDHGLIGSTFTLCYDIFRFLF